MGRLFAIVDLCRSLSNYMVALSLTADLVAEQLFSCRSSGSIQKTGVTDFQSRLYLMQITFLMCRFFFADLQTAVSRQLV